MHVPAVTIVTALPATVHTSGVTDENVTTSPELVVALTPNAPLGLYVCAATAANAMICVALLIVMFCVTCGAGR